MCQFVFRMVRMVIWLALAVPLVTVAATVDVVKGWNLLGNSELTALNVATGLSDPGTVTTVWKWNRTAGTWALFSPSMTSAQLAAYAQTKGYDVLTSIASKESYWVNAVKAGTLTVSLEPPPQVGTPLLVLAASDLGVGWNLLASADGKNPSQFNAALVPNLNAVGKSIQTLWAWDAAGALWKFYSPILAAQGGKALSDYIAQKSYVAFDSAIGVTEGFWANVVTGVTNTTGTTTSTTSTSTTSRASTTAARTTTSTTIPVDTSQVFKDCASCPEMVVIPAGTFQMGSNNGDSYEQPVHSVNIRQFAIGKTEVTQAQWQAVMGSNPSEFKSCGSDCPVENVSWDDAQLFIQKLNANTGKQYRLPTEAEWEYAARAGGTGSWSFGNDATQLGQYAWYNANSGGTTHPVASKLANAFGLFDMYGNVWEWVQDTFHNNYNDAPNDGSAWVTASASSSPWVIRGGSWYYGPAEDRSTKRNVITPGYRSSHGFRVVLANMSKIATPDAYCGYGQWTTRAGSANEGHCASYGDNVQTKVLEEVNNRTDCGGYYKTLGMYSGNNLVAVQISNGNCRAATKDFPYAPPESLDTHCQKYGGTGTYRWAYSPTIQPFGGYGTLGVACEMPVTIN